MSGRSFRSVFMVASCAGAALGCYLVSLHVASERAALEDVETRIVLAQRDIRLLETEIGTRGRLAQLERWNVRVLALSAPSADQFVEGGFALARLIKPEPTIELEAPVVLASAPADAPRPQVPGTAETAATGPDQSATAEELLHVASLKRSVRQELPSAPEAKPEAGRPKPVKVESSSTTAEPKAARAEAPSRSAGSSQAVEKKAGDKPVRAASRPVTKPVRTAKVDPLAPLPTAASKISKDTDSAR